MGKMVACGEKEEEDASSSSKTWGAGGPNLSLPLLTPKSGEIKSFRPCMTPTEDQEGPIENQTPLPRD